MSRYTLPGAPVEAPEHSDAEETSSAFSEPTPLPDEEDIDASSESIPALSELPAWHEEPDDGLAEATPIAAQPEPSCPAEIEEIDGPAVSADPMPTWSSATWESEPPHEEDLSEEQFGEWEVVSPPDELPAAEPEEEAVDPPPHREEIAASRPSWTARFLSNSTAVVLLITVFVMAGVVGWALLSKPTGSRSTVETQRPKAGFPAFDFSEQRRRGAVTENEVAQILAQPEPLKPDPNAVPDLSKRKVKRQKTPRKRANKTPNARLDAVLMDHYGGQRPKVAAFADPEPRSRGTGRRFFKPGGTIDVPTSHKAGGAQSGSDLPPGTRIPARLEVGISSGRHVPVLARATQDVEIAGRVVVPKGALLRGRSSNDERRIYIDFKSVTVGGTNRAISGHAVFGRLPGLSAERREISADERQSTAVVRGVLDTADGLTRGLGGDVVRDLARNVGRESLGEAEKDTQIDRRFLLEAPAGARFMVVVTGVGR